MITFKTIRWKNLLSTGSDFIEINLNRSNSTLIVGQNGAGKSTLLDALSFVLFGKPYRSINKNQLVNSINNKGTLVEVEFKVGNSEFKIVRGIKPSKFEIWQNDHQINQDSNARNFQKFLETNILGLNHKSFHQIVVLGSANFIPFMQLPTQSRREIIEDLLDINIFSRMNLLLKERAAKLKEEMRDLSYHYDLSKDKIKLQQNNIDYLEELAEKERLSHSEDLKAKEEEYEILEGKIAEWEMYKIELKTVRSDLADLEDRNREFIFKKREHKKDIKLLVETGHLFKDNHTCPTCTQEIDLDFKKMKLQEIKESGLKFSESIRTIDSEIADLKSEIDRIKSKEEELSDISIEAAKWIHDLKRLTDEINKIKSTTSDHTALNDAHKELENLKRIRDDMFEKRQKFYESGQYVQAVGEMLKDTGIKTKIIKQYLPVMNKMINQYLQILDFFVSFNIDENFDEVIKSRHRDDFNYASFSEGEKMKIDLALLFTWRRVAKMKNSVATNLLIMDEVMDSSLDQDGLENFMKILKTFDDDNTNVFVISHKRDELEGKFRSKIEFVKEQNFSKMKIGGLQTD
jgi:DNA repair exonuclease SbcCD ATPase subunit